MVGPSSPQCLVVEDRPGSSQGSLGQSPYGVRPFGASLHPSERNTVAYGRGHATIALCHDRRLCGVQNRRLEIERKIALRRGSGSLTGRNARGHGKATRGWRYADYYWRYVIYE